MGDVFSLVGKISVEYSDAVDKIETVTNAADDAAESMDGLDEAAENSEQSVDGSGNAAEGASGKFSKWEMVLANLASGAIQRIIDKTIELAQKIGDLTVKAVGNYADYEQLVGGVETLFKDSADTLVGYAEGAYKTAGLSANDYMETATSFAASLIQGLGGDTAKAVELTNLAITDMSDNANKMGTDMASIQAAYQGFAKQNYTMLDNLKLGYGGTQEEMVRLINDSGILKKKIKDLNGITFDQMIQAIHEIQNNLDITGTTAKEAGDTISGSWSSVQALFENILTKVGAELAPVVMGFLSQLSTWMDSVDWDAFAAKVGNAFGGLLNWLQQIDFTTFFETGLNGVLNFVEGLGSLIDKVVTTIEGVNNFMTILNDLAPVIAGVVTAVGLFSAALKFSSLLDTVKTAIIGVNAVLAANPILAVVSLIAGLVAALVTLWNTNEDFRNAVIAVWDAVKSGISTAVEAIKTTVTTVFNALRSTVTTIFNAIKTAITTPIESAKSTVTNLLNGIKSTFTTVFNGIKSFLSPVVDWLKGIFNFNWSLPKIKLPHFRISGSFSLNPPSVPHFGIEWYKKAMEDGMIMNQPTIFGYNPKSNRFLAGGEAGSETVVGTDSLKEMIRNAVSMENDALAIKLDRIISLLVQFFPDVLVLNNRGSGCYYTACRYAEESSHSHGILQQSCKSALCRIQAFSCMRKHQLQIQIQEPVQSTPT